MLHPSDRLFFFFHDTAPTDTYPLSLHDALPISSRRPKVRGPLPPSGPDSREKRRAERGRFHETRPGDSDAQQVRLERSEEHTSELQSHHDLVCRLLLEKKKKKKY